MSPNPYQPPVYEAGRSEAQPLNRTPLVLAAVGSGLASAYWGVLTLLIALGVLTGGTSGLQLILPCFLIGLYAVRGYQLYKGDPAAANRVMWLHGVGGVMAVVQIASGGAIVMVLQGIKLLIHVFGAVTAYLARRALVENAAQRASY